MTTSDSTTQMAPVATEFYIRAIRKHWLLGAIILAAVMVATVFYTIGQKRIYRAVATIQIDPSPPRPLGKDVQTVVDLGGGSYWSNKEYYGTQLSILRGQSIAREVVRVLGLHHDAAFMANSPPNVTPPAAKQAATIEDAVSVLRSRFSVDPIKESRLVVARFEDANVERARRVLSSLLDVYLEHNVSQVVASAGAASEWLRNQTELLKTELEKSELALHEYKKDKRILSVSLDDQSNMLRGEMQQLTQALTNVNARREGLIARVRELDKVDATDIRTLPASELLNSGILSNLRQDYVHAQAEYDSLLGSGKGENYPATEAAVARVETTRQSLMAEVRNVQGALRGDLVSVSRELVGLSRLFEQAKQRALDLNMLEIEYRRLERSKDNTEKLFGIVLERSKETDLTGMMRFNNISVVEHPAGEKGAVRPRVSLNLGIGLMLGLTFALGLVFAREWLDNRTVRTPEDVEEGIGVPLLGLLPSLAGKVSSSGYYSRKPRHHHPNVEPVKGVDAVPVELIVHSLPSSNAAECARGIRTSLAFASPDKPHQTILVTSASPSEGKTMVATTIAVAFAQAGQRVLLMDCDLRRSRLHRVFKLSNASGVSSALQDPLLLDVAISATIVPNLSVLAAGPHVPNPAEVLQSESFQRLLVALRGKFDRIVIDSPPVLVVTDAAVLGARADTTVVVLRARKTRREVGRKVVAKMKALGANLSGIVLNAIDEPKRKGGYYYGYYSREGYGSGSETGNSG